MGQTIKVLQVMNSAVAGGISAVVLNYYRHTDKEKIVFDCAMPDTKLGEHGRELKKLGCRIEALPLKSRHPIRYWKTLKRLLQEGGYDAIHVHNNETSFFPLFVAKCCGVQTRVAHAHTVRPIKGALGVVKRAFSIFFIGLVSTKRVACSRAAAISIFGKKSLLSPKTLILKNAIEVDRFRFDEKKREAYRAQLGLEDRFVLCCVGNLGPEKNHSFALKILREVLREKENAMLVLVGGGKLREELAEEAKRLGLEKRVLFLGVRSDVGSLLSAMDAFLMPSRYEGFAVAALEGASSGLPIFLSDRIPEDLKFYSHARYLSLSLSPADWANAVLGANLDFNRKDCGDQVKDAGYDLEENREIFASLYQA